MTINSIRPNRTHIATVGLTIGNEDQDQLSPVKLPKVPTSLRMYDLPREDIIILHPTAESVVTTPVSVAGAASLSMETLFVTILDAGGAEIGIGAATVTMTAGGLAHFSAEIPFKTPVNTQPGRIQVWSESRRDGAIQHLSSLTVRLQGYDLDPFLDYLERALAAKDHAALCDAMSNPFRVVHHDGKEQVLTTARQIEQFLQRYLEPGQPALNFTIPPEPVMAQHSGLNLIHAVYSSGWGADGAKAGWLLIGAVGSRAHWAGLRLLSR